MPSLEDNFRGQKAVLWAAAGLDDQGEVTVSSPVEIVVRWDEGSTDPNAAVDELTSVTTTVVVDREISIGSIMRLGALEDLPESPDNLHRVTSYKATPDIKMRHFFRTVTLAWRGNSLPTIV